MNKIVGSRELIRDVLHKHGGTISLDDIRDYAMGIKEGYTLVGVFVPTTVRGKLTYQRIEDELRELTLLKEIDISDGIVSVLKFSMDEEICVECNGKLVEDTCPHCDKIVFVCRDCMRVHKER